MNVRVRDWRAYFSLGVFGLLSGAHGAEMGALALKFAMLACAMAFYLAFAFSINNCFDVESDRLQRRKLAKNPVAAGHLSFGVGVAFSLVLALAGVALNLYWFGSLNPSTVLYVAMLVLAAFYSVPPLRFKSRPFADLISHGLFFGALPYLYGLTVSARLGGGSCAVAASIFTYSLVLELRNHLEDYGGDKAAGVRTTAVHLGYERSQTLLRILLSIHWIYLAAVLLSAHSYAAALPLSSLAYLISVWKRVTAHSHHVKLADALTCLAYASTLLPR